MLALYIIRLAIRLILIITICIVVYVYAITPAMKMYTSKSDHFSSGRMSVYESFKNISIGSNTYKVHEDLDNPKLAAETMDKLNQVALHVIKSLNDKYINDPNGINLIKPEFRQRVISGINDLTKNYKTPNLEENIPERSGGDTSYVIDKGDVFAMCLRDPHNSNMIEPNFNNLTFVLIHEMSHLFTSTYGHDFMFWANFNFILSETVKLGMYDSINYKSVASPYCGIKISYSPLYDTELPLYLM